jgi:tRNA pseudouridine55 synthase
MLSAVHGVLVLDKPPGITSRDAVNRALGWFARGTRIGHTGTLDPLATGVLVLCVGAATRLAEYVQRMDKTYHTGLRLGARSDTDDADGIIEAVPGCSAPDLATVTAKLAGLTGVIDQVPPAYSAAKVAGRRAYKLARRGREVTLESRQVQVYGIDVLAYHWPRLELVIHCGRGTYIRALARDLGERLGCGALVESLRRTHVGPFQCEQALGIDVDAATARSRLLPLEAMLSELPRVSLAEPDVTRLRHGQSVLLPDGGLFHGRQPGRVEVAVFGPADSLIGVAVADASEQRLWPEKVMAIQ